MSLSAVQAALLIFAMRVVDVSAATLRVFFVIRGRKALAWGLGFAQSLVFVLAIRQVMSDLNNWLNMLGYAAGFATGTVVGIWLEARLALGHSHLRVISPYHGHALAEQLRAAGFAVTELAGRGKEGTVGVLNMTVPRRQVAEVQARVKALDPGAFITVEDVRPLWRGFWRR